ncbi:MAG: DUF998 domain-containing protein, partial [Clostridiaceae bacterium]
IMRMKVHKKGILQILSLSGVLTAILFVTHVIAGRLIWREYNPFSQPISYLTADTAVSKGASDIFFILSGVFAVVFCVVMLMYFKMYVIINKLFYSGIIIKTASAFLALLGLNLFSLADTRLGDSFQDIMHCLITGVVDGGYAASAVLMAIGMAKTKKYPGLAKYLIAFCIVYICSGFLSLVAISNFPNYLGLMERVNLYSLQLTNAVSGIWMFGRGDLLYRYL